MSAETSAPFSVSFADCSGVGLTVGVAVGSVIGPAVGLAVGLAVGSAVGLTVGVAVGSAVGPAVGLAVGLAVGIGVTSAICENFNDGFRIFNIVNSVFCPLSVAECYFPFLCCQIKRSYIIIVQYSSTAISGLYQIIIIRLKKCRSSRLHLLFILPFIIVPQQNQIRVFCC